MAIKRLVETKDLKFNSIRQMVMEHQSDLNFHYDKRFDDLILRWIEPKARIIVHYINRNVGLLYEEKTKEIVGIQIEAFEKSFIKEYSKVENFWKLSNFCADLEDFGDMMIACERRKLEIAQEVGQIADELLGGRHGHYFNA